MSGAPVRAGNPQLDHVGVVGRDLARLRHDFTRLGFRLTEPKVLMARDPQDGQLRSLGQSSCHAVFARGYVELSAVETDDPGHHLAAWLPRGPGLRILALGQEDLDARHAHCSEAGLAPLPISHASREIHYGSRRGEARFDWFMLPPRGTPEGLVCFVHNLTPELVYQPEVQGHPNGAVALSAVTLRVGDLEAWTARYHRLLEVDPSSGAGRSVFELSPGQSIELVEAREAAGAVPEMSGFTVIVASTAAARRWLDEQCVPHQAEGGRLWVGPDQASGCRVDMVPA